MENSFAASVAGHTREASEYASTARAPTRIPFSTTGPAWGRSLAAATAAAKTARYARVRPASTYDSSGAIDQVIDAAVTTVKSTNATSAVPP